MSSAGGPGTSAPMISVVVASNREVALLRSCLASLQPQCERVGAELIVARAGGSSTPEISALRAAMPKVRFVDAPADSGIPELRGTGMDHAVGQWVATTEDHCVANEGWLEV